MLLLMDRAIMANQSAYQLVQAGLADETVKLANIPEMFSDLLAIVHKKDTDKYFIDIPNPGPQDGGGGGGQTPQVGNRDLVAANEVQAGSFGGI